MLRRAFSHLIELPKFAKARIFTFVCVTPTSFLFPCELSANNPTFYNCEQKAKGKGLVQMHTDFELVLQVLFHTALDAFKHLVLNSLLNNCLRSANILVKMVHHSALVLR